MGQRLFFYKNNEPLHEKLHQKQVKSKYIPQDVQKIKTSVDIAQDHPPLLGQKKKY
jgi:hypothetical protein